MLIHLFRSSHLLAELSGAALFRYLTYPRQILLGHDDEELRIFIALFSADELDNAVFLVQFNEGPVAIILLLASINNILELSCLSEFSEEVDSRQYERRGT
jgi:hypothetical protein